VPTSLLVCTISWILLVAAPTGRAPQTLGWVVFALYFEWMTISMSPGKADHDRFGLRVAFAAVVWARGFGAARRGQVGGHERPVV
jgi:hypothetical protein